MALLYLFPLDRQLVIRYSPRGWHGLYEIQAKSLEDGEWRETGSPGSVHCEELDAACDGSRIAWGLFELEFKGGYMTVLFGGRIFGKSRTSALPEALEGARKDAAKIREDVARD